MQKGENGHSEYTWMKNGEIEDLLVQLNFQLVRITKNNDKPNDEELEIKIRELYEKVFNNENNENYKDLIIRLICYTRDVVNGKGERDLSYLQLYILYDYDVELCLKLTELFMRIPENIETDETHQYGSWNDMKYFSEYIYKKSGNKDHTIINKMCSIMVDELRKDNGLSSINEIEKISLASKWCPREKSKFKWLNKKVVNEFYKNTIFKRRSKSKKGEFRKLLSKLNRLKDTVEIKMCSKKWSSINFNNVTSKSMLKYKEAFLNKKKNDNEDRCKCSENLIKYLSKETNVIKGSRINVYELVKCVMEKYYEDENMNTIINKQWIDNSKQNSKLSNMIVMSDTSASMTQNNCEPLYSSIGIGIRISELTTPMFRNKILSFSSDPVWMNLNDTMTFPEKVMHIKNKLPWGYNTNFYKALSLILKEFEDNNVNPEDVGNMTLVILSDMQIDQSTTENMNSMFENISKLYEEAGLRSSFNCGYKVPHILFWNLATGNGFPSLTQNKNVSMFSGYSTSLLNEFCENGGKILENYKPFNMLSNMLMKKRYGIYKK
jgi:hypothetical protein